MKELGIPRDRETYRYLMFGCCKYSDVELAIYVMENMLEEGKPDFKSFKRLFDVCAANVDRRLWVAYDVMMWFYPLKGMPSAALRTTCYLTEYMSMLGLRASERAGRGYITLPHHRGDPEDVFAGMFEEDDPNYPDEDMYITEGEEPNRSDRLMLVAEEFQDRHRLREIVAKSRRTEEQVRADEQEQQLVLVDKSKWSVEVITETITKERELEVDRIQRLKESKKKMMEEMAKPLPRFGVIMREIFQKKRTNKKV